MMKRGSIFCASSSLAGTPFKEATTVLPKLLVKENLLIQYGGGGIGLMGCLADAVINDGGHIRGVIPRFMVEEGWVHPRVINMKMVKSKLIRKQHNETWTVLTRPEEVISTIHASQNWDAGNSRATAAL